LIIANNEKAKIRKEMKLGYQTTAYFCTPRLAKTVGIAIKKAAFKAALTL
jgi:hypothetical protein